MRAAPRDRHTYADETGNLDYGGEGKQGASPYFGFGTATWFGDHGDALWSGLKLRVEIENRGLGLARGFHAKDDSRATRHEVFDEIARQAHRFDATLLHKPDVYPRVRARGEMYLYELAWFLHLKYVAVEVDEPGDTLIVVAGSFGTRARATQARAVLHDVCEQVQRDIRLCVWDAPTSWGLQVADHGLWAIQRRLVTGSCSWFESSIQRTLQSEEYPLGKHDSFRA